MWASVILSALLPLLFFVFFPSPQPNELLSDLSRPRTASGGLRAAVKQSLLKSPAIAVKNVTRRSEGHRTETGGGRRITDPLCTKTNAAVIIRNWFCHGQTETEKGETQKCGDGLCFPAVIKVLGSMTPIQLKVH